jgi:uncharacterized protein (DUF305 family)
MERRSIGRMVAGGTLAALLAGALWLAAGGAHAAQTPGRAGAARSGMMGGAAGSGMMGGGAFGGMMDPGDTGGMMRGGAWNNAGGAATSAPFDQRFLDAMIPHHQMAVLSAQRMIAGSGRPEMRDLAQRIITGQQREIDQMTQWRAAWYTGPAAPDASLCGGAMGGYSAGGMMGAGRSGMMGAAGAGMMGGSRDLDRMFLQMMIPHHEVAIRMAQDALTQAGHPEIKALVQQIITTQQAEISEMRGYLQQWYGVTNP